MLTLAFQDKGYSFTLSRGFIKKTWRFLHTGMKGDIPSMMALILEDFLIFSRGVTGPTITIMLRTQAQSVCDKGILFTSCIIALRVFSNLLAKGGYVSFMILYCSKMQQSRDGVSVLTLRHNIVLCRWLGWSP